MTRVKICGIRTLDEARSALVSGADMLGFVFYRPVRRYVEPDQAAAIISACKADPPPTAHDWQAVGVFVDPPADEVNALSRLCGLDLVQLCGDESPALCARLERPAIKVLRAGEEAWTEQRLAETQAGYRVARFMVDSHRDGYYGGTGKPLDWSGLANVMGDKMLAGGLRPDNVAQALAIARPWGVDVSSGVERDDAKDPELVRAFIEAVRGFEVERARSEVGSSRLEGRA